MKEESQGIIIHTIDYKENSKILYLITPYGKESLLLNNAKKLNAGLLYASQALSLVSYRKGNGKLAKGFGLELLDDYHEIKGDIKRFALASYALELLYRDINADFSGEMLYKLVLAFFEELKGSQNLKTLYLEFRVKMLYFLGIQPDFKACWCGNKEQLEGLNINSGQVECYKHKTTGNIGAIATRILKLLYLDKSLKITINNEEALDYLLDVIDRYYEKHSGIHIKAQKLIEDFNNFS